MIYPNQENQLEKLHHIGIIYDVEIINLSVKWIRLKKLKK